VKDVLHVGCGGWIFPNCVNLDRVALPGVDVVHDLDVAPWPFPDGRFGEVSGLQVFEHVADPVLFVNEAWRVLRPGGVLFLTVPHWQSENAFTDPTHRRFCTVRTFDYWLTGTDLHAQMGAAYGPAVFTGTVSHVGDDVHARLVKEAPE
jgi:SAM-dependent methyltransferase